MTGVGAVLNTAQVPREQAWLFSKVGGIGLNCIQGGALMAANPIVAVDVNRDKFDYAQQLGATHCVDASEDNPVKVIKQANV
ncbi:hypothetical protein CMK12_17355 [Candidatus Poribacteria bacterium]|nr:hypothetical protein [Candidatus Poribacteria bacterium]